MKILKQIKLFFLIANAFIKKETKLIIFSFILAIGLFFIVTKVIPYMPRPKPTIKIGIVGSYTFETLPTPILKLVSSGLTKIDSDGMVIPSLAEKWESESEGKSYTFYLADNIYWQDGTPITSKDINLNLKDVTINKINDKTIVFSLPEPYSPFPSLLAEPIFKENRIGTGRYRVTKINNNGSFIKSLFLTGPDNNLFYSFYPTDTAAFLAFKLGEIDQLPEIYSNPFDNNWSNYLTVEENIKKNQYIGLFINNLDNNLADKNLRQALAYATIKPSDETKVTGPINPNSWAYNSEVKSYEANAKQAKKLYLKFLEDNNKESLKLKIDTTSNFLLLAEQIKNNWQEILGIETEISLIDKVPSDFQILLIVSQIPDDPDQYSFWHSTQESNITKYKSPKVDKLLEDGRRILELDQRKEKYLDFQKFILEDSPVIFISHPKTLTIKRRGFLSRLSWNLF